MGFQINGVDVEEVNFNGEGVSEVQLDGVTVWQAVEVPDLPPFEDLRASIHGNGWAIIGSGQDPLPDIPLSQAGKSIRVGGQFKPGSGKTGEFDAVFDVPDEQDLDEGADQTPTVIYVSGDWQFAAFYRLGADKIGIHVRNVNYSDVRDFNLEGSWVGAGAEIDVLNLVVGSSGGATSNKRGFGGGFGSLDPKITAVGNIVQVYAESNMDGYLMEITFSLGGQREFTIVWDDGNGYSISHSFAGNRTTYTAFGNAWRALYDKLSTGSTWTITIMS